MKIKFMGWQPEHHSNNAVVFLIGLLVGIWKYIANFHLPIDLSSKMLEGAAYAGVCGFASVAGKWLFGIAKEHFTEYFQNRKKHKNGNKN